MQLFASKRTLQVKKRAKTSENERKPVKNDIFHHKITRNE